jgi:hypothetical protein
MMTNDGWNMYWTMWFLNKFKRCIMYVQWLLNKNSCKSVACKMGLPETFVNSLSVFFTQRESMFHTHTLNICAFYSLVLKHFVFRILSLPINMPFHEQEWNCILHFKKAFLVNFAFYCGLYVHLLHNTLFNFCCSSCDELLLQKWALKFIMCSSIVHWDNLGRGMYFCFCILLNIWRSAYLD